MLYDIENRGKGHNANSVIKACATTVQQGTGKRHTREEMERYKQGTKYRRTTEKVARFWQGKENEARTKHEKTPKFYPSVKDPTAKKKQ